MLCGLAPSVRCNQPQLPSAVSLLNDRLDCRGETGTWCCDYGQQEDYLRLAIQ